MAYQDIVNVLARRQDSFLDGLNQLLNPRQQTKGVVTVVAVTTIVAPKTFDGSAVYVTQTGGDAIAGGAVFASRTSAAETEALTTDTTSSLVAQSTSQLTTPLTTPIYSTPAAVTSSSGTANSSGAKSSDNSGGLSGGAKAGIAFGVMIPLAALLIGALILMRRKKQKEVVGERLDDEKANVSGPDALPSFPAPAPAPGPAPQMAVRSQQNTLAAPRLELRPESKFDPRISKLGGPGGAMTAGALGAAAVGGAAAGNRSPSPNSSSAWDRPGAEKHANNPANPFGNHAETVNQSQAAIAAQPRAPSPGHIDAADFPLPVSTAPSERAISLQAETSSDNLSMAPSNPATASNLSLAPQNAQNSMSAGQMAGAAAAVGAVAGGAALAAGAANKRNSPPPGDTVFRVQLDFKPSMEDELEIRAGQLVRCLHEYDDGWALCSRMDRSQQGVVPRTCLSKAPVKPRAAGPPPQGRPGPAAGPGMRGPPNGPPRAMTPNGGRNSPAPYAQAPRPLTPSGRNSPAPGRNSPAPFNQQPRPMSPAGPQGRARAQSNAPAYGQYNPQQRSMSPGPYGPPGQMRPPSRPDQASRRRSNSMSNLAQGQGAPIKPLSPVGQPAQVPSRKPVPGQAV